MSEKRRFYFRLALGLGCTVAELLRRLSSAELSEWMRYWNVEPWGEERADMRAAIVACTVARSQGAKAKTEDFMPRYEAGERKAKLTPRQIAEREIALMKARFGGKRPAKPMARQAVKG